VPAARSPYCFLCRRVRRDARPVGRVSGPGGLPFLVPRLGRVESCVCVAWFVLGGVWVGVLVGVRLELTGWVLAGKFDRVALRAWLVAGLSVCA
jgi:hypothetical protein